MKKFFLILMIFLGLVLMGCNKEKDPVEPEQTEDNEKTPLWEEAEGSIWINDNPDVTIESKDEYPEERETLFY